MAPTWEHVALLWQDGLEALCCCSRKTDERPAESSVSPTLLIPDDEELGSGSEAATLLADAVSALQRGSQRQQAAPEAENARSRVTTADLVNPWKKLLTSDCTSDSPASEKAAPESLRAKSSSLRSEAPEVGDLQGGAERGKEGRGGGGGGGGVGGAAAMPALVRKESLSLLLATQVEDLTVVRDMLADRSQDVNAADSDGQTPLHMAAARCRVDLIEALLGAKADPNRLDSSATAPLHVAAFLGSARAVSRLLAAGARPDLEDDTGCTALAMARQVLEDQSLQEELGSRASHSEYQAVVDLLEGCPSS